MIFDSKGRVSEQRKEDFITDQLYVAFDPFRYEDGFVTTTNGLETNTTTNYSEVISNELRSSFELDLLEMKRCPGSVVGGQRYHIKVSQNEKLSLLGPFVVETIVKDLMRCGNDIITTIEATSHRWHRTDCSDYKTSASLSSLEVIIGPFTDVEKREVFIVWYRGFDKTGVIVFELQQQL